MKISNNSQISLLQFENDVLEKMASLAEYSNEAPILKEQLAHAIILSRQMTGHGFFLEFSIETDTPVFLIQNFEINAVNARLHGLKSPVGFVLFIKNGKIKTLEGFANGEPWPDPWPPAQNFQYEFLLEH